MICKDEQMNKNADLDYFSAPNANILIVDDQEINIFICTEFLKSFDIVPDTAYSGFEAIQKVQEKDYDIILMDYLMPKMNGIETMQNIRKLGDKYKRDNLCIIVITSDTSKEDINLFMKVGMNDFLAKPINIITINTLLKSWLPKSKQYNKSNVPTEEYELTSTLKRAESIKGLNISIGLNYIRNVKDYETSLKLLNRKIHKSCSELNNYFNNDMNRFIIEIHGVKGVLLTNGHVELSNLALELELESKNGNMEFCKNNLPIFLIKLKEFGDSLNELYYIQAVEQKKQGNQEILKDAVAGLKRYISCFDRKNALKVVEHMLNYTFSDETDKNVIQINEALEDFDFEFALELLPNLTSLISTSLQCTRA